MHPTSTSVSITFGEARSNTCISWYIKQKRFHKVIYDLEMTSVAFKKGSRSQVRKATHVPLWLTCIPNWLGYVKYCQDIEPIFSSHIWVQCYWPMKVNLLNMMYIHVCVLIWTMLLPNFAELQLIEYGRKVYKTSIWSYISHLNLHKT